MGKEQKPKSAKRSGKHRRLRISQHKTLLVIFCIGFAVIGAVTLGLTRAASPGVAKQPENGKVSFNATSFNDVNASGGGGVQFGSGTPAGASILNGSHFNDTQMLDLNDRTNGYSSMEVDITPEVEQGTAGYYYANTVWYTNYTGNNSGVAYAGLQTNGFNGTSYIGHMAIFSVWDVTSGIAEQGGVGVPFSGEGTGFSVRLPYAWQVSHVYRLKIYLDTLDAGNGQSLWAAGLTDLNTGTTTRIGRIYVPTARGKIYGSVLFHERYSTSTNTANVAKCSDLTPSRVSFNNATANNGAIIGHDYSHYYRANDAACPGLAYIQDMGNGFRSSVNAP